MQRPLRRSRSFKVTDFGTNRKLIYDLLLVINTKLAYVLSCTASKLWLIIGQIFASERGVPHFNALATVDPLPISPCISDMLKLYILWPAFLPQKDRCIFKHFYVIRPEIYRIRWNYAAVCRSRSPSSVPIESSYATSYWWLIVTYILHCFRDIAFERSIIAIFGYPSCDLTQRRRVPLGRSP